MIDLLIENPYNYGAIMMTVIVLACVMLYSTFALISQSRERSIQRKEQESRETIESNLEKVSRIRLLYQNRDSLMDPPRNKMLSRSLREIENTQVIEGKMMVAKYRKTALLLERAIRMKMVKSNNNTYSKNSKNDQWRDIEEVYSSLFKR